MPLNDRARIILFWITIALMLAVAVLAGVTILRACGGLPTQTAPALAITPEEVSLCPGDQQQFAVARDTEVIWEANGGTINADGVYTAGDSPGDYTVTASREESRQAAAAIVHVVACTPTPTVTPMPTIVATATPEQTAAPEPTATLPANPDAEGDVGDYETGVATESPPSGVDILAASINPDLTISLELGEDLPTELTDWTEEGEVLFWLSLYNAIPDSPSAYTNWLFVVDTDGNTETGRTAGSRRINPDLGDELAIGVSYDANTSVYEPYALVWDSEQEAWVDAVSYTHLRAHET